MSGAELAAGDVPVTAGRSRYPGFRATIKAVGTGPRGSRPLAFDEARDAARAVLAGEVTPAQAGAFLIAMRMKGEEAAELAGVAQALRDARIERADDPGGDVPIVATSGSYDGMADTPSLSLAAAVVAAAAGARMVVHCAGQLGPKYGVTPLDVFGALGATPDPVPAASRAMLAQSGVAVVHTGRWVPGFDALVELRNEIGLRGPVHSAEKLIDHLGATCFVIGHTHSTYTAKLVQTMETLGAARAVIVRGVEGSDVPRPGRPAAFCGDERLDLPETMGLVLRGEADADVSAQLTRAIVAGEETGVAWRAVSLGAAVHLYCGGIAATPRVALAMAEAAVADGRATRTLERLLDASR